MTAATLLIVEDDGILAANLEILLTGLGYRVLGPVATGEEAIALLSEQPADLVLMDIELAGALNGIETAEELNRDMDIPIVFLTGFSHDPLLDQAKIVAPYGYLIKPVPERELAATVTMSLHRHALDRQLKESRRLLAASEARYRHLFDHSPLGIFRTTLEGKTLYMNRAMAAIAGCSSPDEAISALPNLTRQLLVDPTERREALAELTARGELRNREMQARRKDGESFWMAIDARLHAIDESIEPSLQVIDGFALDISERKTAELALLESEQRHRTYLMSTPYAVFATDLEGRYIQVNPSACRLSGYPEEELLAMTVADLHFPEDRSAIAATFAGVVRGDRFQGEIPVRIKSGERRWWSITAVNIEGHRLLGFCNDITERRVAEEALRASETNFRTFFASMGDMVLVTDLNGAILAANKSTCQTLGYAQEDLTALHLPNLYPPKQRHQAKGMWPEILNGQLDACRLPLQTRAGDPVPVTLRAWRGLWDGAACAYATFRNLSAEEEAEQRFEQLFRRNPALLALTTVDDQRFVDVNDIWLATLGYKANEVIGRTPLELNLFPVTDSFLQATGHLRDTGQIADLELQVRCKDGSIRYGLFSGELIRSHGQSQCLTVMIDITERKRIEQALEQRILALVRPLDDAEDLAFEELFDLDDLQRIQDQFAEATGVASLITRPDGTPITKPSNFCRLCTEIIRTSPKGLANCRRSDAQIGAACIDGPMVQPCMSGGLWDAGAAIVVGGRHLASWLIGQVRDESQNEAQMRRYAREIEVAEDLFLEAFREVPIMSKQQFTQVARALFTLAGHLSATAYQNVQQARFITEKKRTEEALQASRERLHSVFRVAPTGIGMVRDRVFVEVNERVCTMTGYDASEMIGRNARFLYPSEAEYELVGREKYRQIDEKGYGEVETRWLREDGRIIDILLASTPVDPDDRAKGTIFTALDITDRRRAEEEKRALQAQLLHAQKLEAIGTLAGGIAHDFNNILAAVIGYADMARDSVDDHTPLSKDLDNILKAGHRAKDLVKQILAFSRQNSTEPAVLFPALIVKEVVKLLRPSLPTTIAIEQDIDPKAGPVMIDPTNLHQMLMNLCTNAFHAMEEQGGVLTLGLRRAAVAEVPPTANGAASGDYVVLTVADTGNGIPESIRHRIFDPFFTTKGAGKGTGMGLAILHGLVTGAGGWVELDTTPGKGSTFRIFFPVVAQPIAADRSAAEQAPVGSGHILFVDDEAILTEMAKTMLEQLGYLVTVRTSSLEALATFQNHPDLYDLVITDQTMPGMTGIDLARRLLTLRPELPIILCTGYSGLISRDQARAAGIRDLALKPLTKKELASLIKKVLNPG